MLTKYCSILFYVLAIIAQSIAAAYALRLFFRSQSYRLASGALALGFSLMIGRRISPLMLFYLDGYYNLFDACLALLISTLLLLGLHQVKKIIVELQEKNFILDRTSKTDSLTQVLSRFETFARAELEIERALRNQQSLAFLMLDIDHFKNVNDQYGHPAGDLVLQHLAKICKAELRVIDILGRVGGEEFLIILPDVSSSLAFEVAERVRQKIASSPAMIPGVGTVSFTVSIGVALFDPHQNPHTQAPEILKMHYQRVDEAMYQAKAGGRNRCVTWNP